LIDTFNDEKFEAVRVAEALGPDLYAIRLDTPASRRGNFREILQEVRWELDLRGFEHVRLFASGGLTESAVESLSDLVDGFGVGTEISAAPVVDFSMDIVEIDGEPIAKRGKMSGSKSMWRCATCGAEFMTPRNHRPEHEHDTVEDLVQPLLDRGGFVSDLPTPSAIRQRVLDALDGEELV
jgi:nicotinate phosphoribosyltransferase